jgi:two-component system response regulator FixJ
MPRPVTDKPRISVVDDDEAVRDALGDLLAALGYSVRTFESADDFIENKGAVGAACLITDMQMPGMTGLELMEHLTQTGVTIPVIVVSAHTQVATQARALRNGAVAWLDKPVRQQQLMESLARAMN